MRYDTNRLNNTKFLSEADLEIIRKLNSQFSLNDLRQHPSFVNKLMIDFIYSSALIEGNTYDLVDTLTLLNYGQTAGGKKYSEARMILNLRDAFDYINALNAQVSIEDMYNLHKIIMNGELEDSSLGVIRNESVRITGVDYIPFDRVTEIYSELKHLWETSLTCSNPLDRSIYLHLNLAYLQAFKDGNKRISRFLQNAVLLVDNIIPLMFDHKSIGEYIRSLLYYYETGDSKRYVNWFISEYKRMYEINGFISNSNSDSFL